MAGGRSCRPLDGAAPAAVFAAVEAPALGPLPATPFVLATWSTGKVGPDIHVKVGPALCSVPWRLLGQQVHARCTATMVQVVHEDQVVATHVRRERGRATTVEHYPPERIAFHMRTPTWCQQVGEQVGPACCEVVATPVGGQCPVPPSRRPGRPGAAGQTHPDPPGSRVRQGDRRRRPVLPHHQGHPDRRHRGPPRPAVTPVRSAWPPVFRRSCTARKPCSSPTKTVDSHPSWSYPLRKPSPPTR